MEWKQWIIKLAREAKEQVFIAEITPEMMEEIKKVHSKATPKPFAIIDGTLVCNYFDTEEEAEKELLNWKEE